MHRWIRAAALLLLVGCGPRTAQMRADGFVYLQTQDVRLRTDLGEGPAKALVKRLQRMRDYFDERLFPCARGIELPPIRVVALAHQEDMAALRPGAGGYYTEAQVPWLDPLLVIRASLDDNGRTVRVFNHELAHRFVALCYPRAPVWLNEGIAELFETLLVVGDRRVQLGVAPYVFGGNEGGWAHGPVPRLVIPDGDAPSLSALRAMTWREFYGDGQTGNYAGAWSAVHLLQLGDPALHRQFTGYLAALRRADEPEALIWDRFFGAARMDDAVRRYRRSPTFRSAFDELPPPPRDEPTVSEIEPADAHLLWAELYLRTRHLNEGLEHLELARVARPNAPRADLLEASSEHALGHGLSAIQLLRRAVARPDAPHATTLMFVSVAEPGEPGVDDATRRLQEAPDDAETLAVLATHALRTGHADEAISIAGQALRENRLCWRCMHVLGRAYLSNGQPQRALGPLESALPLLGHGSPRGRRAVEADLWRVREALRQAPTPSE